MEAMGVLPFEEKSLFLKEVPAVVTGGRGAMSISNVPIASTRCFISSIRECSGRSGDVMEKGTIVTARTVRI